MYDDLRSRLQEAEGTIRKLREERGRLNRLFQSARAAAEDHESDQTLGAAMAAKQAVAEVDSQIEEATDRQVRLLKRLGDIGAGMPGFTSFENGWAQAAKELDLAGGKLHVDLNGASLIRAQAQPGGGAGNAGTAATIARGPRWIGPPTARCCIRGRSAGAVPGELAVREFGLHGQLR